MLITPIRIRQRHRVVVTVVVPPVPLRGWILSQEPSHDRVIVAGVEVDQDAVFVLFAGVGG